MTDRCRKRKAQLVFGFTGGVGSLRCALERTGLPARCSNDAGKYLPWLGPVPCQHRSCPCAAFGGSSPSRGSSFHAWLGAEGAAGSLLPLDGCMGCGSISPGSLLQGARGRQRYLLMMQFVPWGWS